MHVMCNLFKESVHFVFCIYRKGDKVMSLLGGEHLFSIVNHYHGISVDSM